MGTCGQNPGTKLKKKKKERNPIPNLQKQTKRVRGKEIEEKGMGLFFVVSPLWGPDKGEGDDCFFSTEGTKLWRGDPIAPSWRNCNPN